MTIKTALALAKAGNAYKAALALQLSGLDWEPVKVDSLWRPRPAHRITAPPSNNMGEPC